MFNINHVSPLIALKNENWILKVERKKKAIREESINLQVHRHYFYFSVAMYTWVNKISKNNFIYLFITNPILLNQQ